MVSYYYYLTSQGPWVATFILVLTPNLPALKTLTAVCDNLVYWQRSEEFIDTECLLPQSTAEAWFPSVNSVPQGPSASITEMQNPHPYRKSIVLYHILSMFNDVRNRKKKKKMLKLEAN